MARRAKRNGPKPGMTVSPSQLDSMSCRFAWYLGYNQGYRNKKSAISLELGTGVHYGLEMYYGQQLDPVESFLRWAEKRREEMDLKWDDDKKEFEDAVKLGSGMLAGYLAEYHGKERFEVIATERTLMRQLPIPMSDRMSPYWVSVRLDGIVRDLADGKIYSLEHKTFSRLTAGHLERDHQMTAQVWVGESVLAEMGIEEPIIGVIYNGLRKCLPGPRVTHPLFHRQKVYRTSRQVEVFLHRAYWQKKEFSKRDLPIYPQPNAVRCGTCDFREVCTEYQRGGDWQFLLDTNFRLRDDKPENKPDEAVTDSE